MTSETVVEAETLVEFEKTVRKFNLQEKFFFIMFHVIFNRPLKETQKERKRNKTQQVCVSVFVA